MSVWMFKIIDTNKKPVKKAKVQVHITNGGTADAISERDGFVAVPITGGNHGKLLVNGKECYEGPMNDEDTLEILYAP